MLKRVRTLGCKHFVAGVVAATALSAATVAAQNPGLPGSAIADRVAGAKPVPQVELTESSARGAIDAYMAIRDKYGDEMPALKKGRTSLDALDTLQGVESIVGGHGFTDTSDWNNTLVSVAMAYGFNKEGRSEEVEKSIAKIKRNAELPDTLKQKMIAMIEGVRPSENNLAVVKALMADQTYAEKLAEIGIQ